MSDNWNYANDPDPKDPDFMDKLTNFFASLGDKIFSRIPKREPYLIEVIQIEETQHNHYKFKTKDLFTMLILTASGKPNLNVGVEPKDLYEVPGGLKGFFRWILTGRKNHYLMIVDEEGKPIVETQSEITGKVLKVARDWKGLGKAIKDSFGSRFEIPRIALIALVFVSVAIMIYLVSKGFIPLPRSWTQ